MIHLKVRIDIKMFSKPGAIRGYWGLSYRGGGCGDL